MGDGEHKKFEKLSKKAQREWKKQQVKKNKYYTFEEITPNCVGYKEKKEWADKKFAKSTTNSRLTENTSSTVTTDDSYWSKTTRTTTVIITNLPTNGKLMAKKKSFTANGGTADANGKDETGADLTNTACESALGSRNVEVKVGDELEVDLFEQFYIQANEDVAAPKGASGIFSYLMPEAAGVSQEEAPVK